MFRDPIHTIGGTSSRSIACVMLDQCCVHHNQKLMRELWSGPGMIRPILKPILGGLMLVLCSASLISTNRTWLNIAGAKAPVSQLLGSLRHANFTTMAL